MIRGKADGMIIESPARKWMAPGNNPGFN